MALRIAPAPSNPTHTITELGAPSAPGVHDTLRHNLGLTSAAAASSSSYNEPTRLVSTHPLEARLANWRATQDSLKMEGLKRQFGIGEPLRRGMELQIASASWMPRVLGGISAVHSDILSGRDCEIGWEDVFKGDELREPADFHSEMESRLHMNW